MVRGVAHVAPNAYGSLPKRPLIVVEVGQSHEGSESFAHAHIDEVAESGADAIKFQAHIATAESSVEDHFRVEKSFRRESRFNYWKRHELSPEVMGDLVSHARQRDLGIGFSTFSLEGLKRVELVRPDFLKIGSGEALQKWFLEAASRTRLPIVLSTGLSTITEIAEAIDILSPPPKDLTLLQCVTSYPSGLENIGLNVISELRDRFGVEVGLSDHSAQLAPAVFAIANGASMVEIHGTFSKKAQGPDSDASLEFREISLLAQLRDAWLTMSSNPVDKKLLAADLLPMREVFGRSLAIRRTYEVGDEVEGQDIYFAKPGGGLPPENLEALLGKTFSRRVLANSLLKWEDFE